MYIYKCLLPYGLPLLNFEVIFAESQSKVKLSGFSSPFMCRWQDNIKMDVRQIGSESLN